MAGTPPGVNPENGGGGRYPGSSDSAAGASRQPARARVRQRGTAPGCPARARGGALVTRVLLAVDGGNSKTDLALVRDDGELLAFERGPMSSPHHIGLHGCLDILEQLYKQAAREAGLDPAARPLAGGGQVLLAGADLPEEERELAEAVWEHSFAADVEVGNDTFAVLRAGSELGWGVAVTCGAGINCI